ncbi:MAG: serine/threonine-protein kinase [Verrucomicrobiia bacterium]
MSTTGTCSICGAPLPRGVLGKRCARCLLQTGLAAQLAEAQRESEVVEPGGRRFGDYELLEEIGHGGMGIVFKARQLSLDRTVAVKMLLSGAFATPEFLQRFRVEAQAAANLRHPNIVAAHDFGEIEGQLYLSMDYVPGRNLEQLTRKGPLNSRQAATYMRLIAQAVQYAHQQGILHRDLKPSNILIDNDDQPRLTDFGLAKRQAGDSSLTLTGQTLGSPNYIPPEQAGGQHARIGPASDIYSLGAVLFHLLTGRAPFAAETITATLRQVQEVDPVAPRRLNPGIPRDLEIICLKCLEKEPARRYALAGEFADELERFLNGEPIRARPVSLATRAWRWGRRNPRLRGVSGVAAFVILGGVRDRDLAHRGCASGGAAGNLRVEH